MDFALSPHCPQLTLNTVATFPRVGGSCRGFHKAFQGWKIALGFPVVTNLALGVVVSRDYFILAVPKDLHTIRGNSAQSPDFNVA